MLQLYINEKKTTSKLALQVAAKTKEAKMYCETAEEAKRYIESSIKEIKSSNHIQADYSYRIIPVNDKFFELWHFRPDGAQEYLFASITKI